MVCPKCGSELPKDHLYCEKCGEEIHIVPEFEPAIENTIEETRSVLAEVVDESTGYKSEKGDSQVKETEKPFKSASVFKLAREKMYIFIGAVAVIVLIVIVIAVNVKSENNIYQTEKAEEYAKSGDYESAIACMEKVISSDDTNPANQIILADYYLENNQRDNAVLILKQVIATFPDNEPAYEKLISIYKADGDYDKINEILIACDEQNILSTFQNYMANSPSFSEESGNYEELLTLKLSANTAGTIYYTIDGTKADADSTPYTSPLFLDVGKNVINAVFINEYGIISENIEKSYYIDVNIPLSPTVNLDSGTYEMPMTIELDVHNDYTAYYTLDGSVPSKDSTPYIGPIPMPLSDSYFRFVVYSKEGVAGEITERKYTLNLNADITVQDAINLITSNLVQNGTLINMQGYMVGNAGHNTYQCTSAFTLDDQIFYLVFEYYEDVLGASSKTGNIYAVNVNSGELYRASTNYNGYYVVEGF